MTLFKKGQTIPRLHVFCPACQHESEGCCHQQYKTIRQPAGDDYSAMEYRNVYVGEVCCKCGHIWDERQFDIVATEDVP